jgi:hypothetical protein
MDFSAALEIAKTLFAGISAGGAAIDLWQRNRDKQKAAEAFDQTYTATRDSKQGEAAARDLADVIPPEVLTDLEARADLCWTGYRTVLGGKYLPDEVDRATDAVKACVCRELWRIHALNGTIPDLWKPQWHLYDCSQTRNRP